MKTNSWVAAAFILVLAGDLSAQDPPAAMRVQHTDTYHGVRVADPYRWMEDMLSDETLAWVRAQDAHARRLTAVPVRSLIRERLDAVYGGARFRTPLVREDREFFLEWSGPESRVLMREGGAPAQVVLDPRTLDPSGESQITRFVPSEDGRYVAYGVASTGSRWETWFVRDVETGRDLVDRLVGLNGGRSGAVDWTHDGLGFFYERFTPPEEGQELNAQLLDEEMAYHLLGTRQSADRLVLDPEDETTGIVATMTRDGRYLVLQIGEAGALENRVHYIDLEAGGRIVPLIDQADFSYTFIGSVGRTFWLMTDRDAPNWKVIAVDLDQPSPEHWRDLIPEGEHAMDPTIGAVALGDKILAGYREDARLAIHAYHADGRHAYRLVLPGGGDTWGFAGRQNDPYAYYRLQSAVDPGTIYRLTLATGESTEHVAPDLPYDPQDFVTRQVFYESADGTRIPMFLVHHKDLQTDGTNPVFMYGYGAFNWAAAPWFQPVVAVWLQMGGVYALPNIRGGGEYGERWHQAGIRRNKQQSIDDFLAAGEWLIANGYTSNDLLVGNGGSASGPLIGAALVQRPDLFAASIIDYPALDMLRLEAFTGGRAWGSDFGSVEDPDDFRALLAYSPYHNLAPGTCYPPTMISPGSKDETTVPMHAYKFAAALQHAQACDNPVLLRVSWNAGHSAGVTLDDRMDTWADQLAFLVRVLDLDLTMLAAR